MRLFGFEFGSTFERHGAERITLVLGGGGARGLAHLGVLRAIDEQSVSVERMVGVSIGALVGAVSATSKDLDEVLAKSFQLIESPFLRRLNEEFHQDIKRGQADSTAEINVGAFAWFAKARRLLSAHRRLTRGLSQPSLLSDIWLREAIDKLIPDIDLADVSESLKIIALDLNSGQRITLESGPLRLAVQASMSIPGIFPPVQWPDSDHLLCDSGVIDSLPVDLARSCGPNRVIAVDVGQNLATCQDCRSAMDVTLRVGDIGESLMRPFQIAAADIVIRPQVGEIAWFDFAEPDGVIEAGYQAAIATLSQPSVDRVA